jgi:hypothetical protein
MVPHEKNSPDSNPHQLHILFFSNLKMFAHHKLVIFLKPRINSQNTAMIFNKDWNRFSGLKPISPLHKTLE